VNARLNVHRFGPADGPSLVALHGLGGHGRRWRALAAEQLPGFQVHAPDLRGHGLSVPGPPWTLEQHAADVLAAMDDLGLRRAAVMGHSLGAVVAVYLSRQAPPRIDRLILLDPAMGIPSPVADQLAHEALRVPEFDSPQEAGRARARSWPAQARRLVDDEVDAHLVRGDDNRWRWRYSAPARVTAHSELARPAVTPPPGVPTLLVVARRSRAISPEYLDACRSALGDLLTVEQVDCGHQVHLERPEQTGQIVRQFLGGGSGAAG
jgi:lipase